MTETKFTKGPWSINLNNKLHSVYAKRPEYETRPWMLDHLFSVATMVEGSEQERIANATLIAAAPEMYDELAKVGAVINEFLYAKGDDRAVLRNDLKESVGKIKTLLAKARGEEEG